MMENEMNLIYREIAETVVEMIPEDWQIFYYYAQISETGGGTYFFYNTPEDEQNFKYSLEIPFKYNIDKEHYKIKNRLLLGLSEKLRKIFIDHEQEPWYSFTLSLDRNGKFKIHYDYTNWFDTTYSFDDQLLIWEYKYLGSVPRWYASDDDLVNSIYLEDIKGIEELEKELLKYMSDLSILEPEWKCEIPL